MLLYDKVIDFNWLFAYSMELCPEKSLYPLLWHRSLFRTLFSLNFINPSIRSGWRDHDSACDRHCLFNPTTCHPPNVGTLKIELHLWSKALRTDVTTFDTIIVTYATLATRALRKLIIFITNQSFVRIDLVSSRCQIN